MEIQLPCLPLIPGDVLMRYTVPRAYALGLLAGKKQNGRFGQPLMQMA